MDVADGAATRPAAGRRRVEIARDAAELFARRGFHAVRMNDIAEAGGITARALYRHYANKQALLAHVIREDQQHVLDAIAALERRPPDARGLENDLTAMVAAALDSRRLSVLWQREARHLTSEDYALVRRRTRFIAERFRVLLVEPAHPDLGEDTADLRSWVVVSLVSGPGFYDTTLSRARLERSLVAAGTRVIRAPAVESVHPTTEAERPTTARREQLIDAAAREFRAKGFAGVSMDDIGAEVGVVGPALYRYVDTKVDLLSTAVTRLHEWLALETRRSLRCPSDDEVLGHLVSGYIRVACDATDLLATSLTEKLYLPDNVLDRTERSEADSFGEWQRWLVVRRPDLAEAEAATLVRAARTVIDDCVRIPHLRRHPAMADELRCAALATMGLT
ncbi:TetR/AcrR family transcriptional regulator [Actinomycetospora termitidis]|uniref:Helix-turn-helix domain-containing protein n=1 Tax=Actinomycetospora termitidis TaxID=3053470 RepID=A0ABT7MG93_9PSEU|nr:TetR/AcrR family transcriptional regulator [Actinomycetospora sp. Odt1-22]MDL5159698.1 helix-turn-helix domain-containing protein [Actinomycetospora sp. Odt1-22]